MWLWWWWFYSSASASCVCSDTVFGAFRHIEHLHWRRMYSHLADVVLLPAVVRMRKMLQSCARKLFLSLLQQGEKADLQMHDVRPAASVLLPSSAARAVLLRKEKEKEMPLPMLALLL